MNSEIKKYLSSIGKKGGLKSRRILTREQASEMVKVRQAKKYFKLYYNRCFWSFSPDYKVQKKDIRWVAEQLMKNGDRTLWEIGTKLCR